MFLKAIMVCDSVRLDIDGTMTLVGVYNERIVVPAATGGRPPAGASVRFSRLMFVTTVGGLAGVDRLRYRHTLRIVGAPAALANDQLLQDEAHDPAADEHSFIFGDSPMDFPGEGSYELSTQIEAAGQRATYGYRFRIECAPN